MPNSLFKTFWNSLIVILMIYTATVLSYRICFIDSTTVFWSIFDLAANVIFGIDIIINFLSAYYDSENVLVTNNKYIIINYL
jgi:hypothetical protein